MIYTNRTVPVVNGLAVGFDAEDKPTVVINLPPGRPRPSEEAVFNTVLQRREALVRELALMTAWMEAAVTPSPNRIQVVPGGALAHLKV